MNSEAPLPPLPPLQPQLPVGWTLRPMEYADLEAVEDLQRRAFAYPWSAALLRAELDHSWSTVLLAERDAPHQTRLMGVVVFWIVHDELHILNVATSPDAQRQGVARMLITEALGRARSRGCVLATLEVRRSNLPAIALYEGFGFRTVGVRPRYYANEGEDALVMERRLQS